METVRPLAHLEHLIAQVLLHSAIVRRRLPQIACLRVHHLMALNWGKRQWENRCILGHLHLNILVPRLLPCMQGRPECQEKAHQRMLLLHT